MANPNIVGQINRNSPVQGLLAIRQMGEETRRQDRLDESNLRTADINQRLGEANLAQTEQDVQAGIVQSIGVDTLGVKRLLDGARVNPELQKEAGALMVNIIDRMERIGAPTGQAARLAMLAATDIEGAIAFMDKHSIPALLAKMPDLIKSEILSDSQVTAKGQVIERRSDGTITAINVQDFVKESGNLSILSQVMPDGQIRTIQGDGNGGFFDLQGKKLDISPDARLVENTTLSGSQADLGLNDPEMKELRDSEVATRTFIATATDAIKMLDETPDINTFVASAANIANNIKQEARAVGRALGVEIDVGLLEPDTHADTFDALGISNQEMRGMITSLAYQAAAASGQAGRDVSNRDVVRFIQEIGGSSTDPRAFKASIRNVADRTDRAFRINYATRLGKEFDGDLGIGQLGGEPQSDPNDLSGLSDEEFLNMLNAPVAQ